MLTDQTTNNSLCYTKIKHGIFRNRPPKRTIRPKRLQSPDKIIISETLNFSGWKIEWQKKHKTKPG